MNGGFSGGTIASIINMVEQKKHRELANIYLLNPEKPKISNRINPHDKDQKGVIFSKDINAWTGPFIMASSNTRVVRRSAELLNYGQK